MIRNNQQSILFILQKWIQIRKSIIFLQSGMIYKRKMNLLWLFALISLTQSFSLWNLSPLPKTNGAMCMDGSQYGIYTFDPDSVMAVNKMLIYFEEIWQNWCAKDNLNDSITRCFRYVNDTNLLNYGSSNNWGGSFTILNGILSGNSIFASWPKVMIKSCDGGSYFSDSNTTFKNKTLNFKGSKNVQQAINFMNKNNLLANREQVIIVGVGNGGLAALAWADTIKSNTKGKVRVMVDGGIWQNELYEKTKSPVFENRMKTMDKFFLNGKNFPNSKCQAANKDEISRCFYASQLTKYIDPSIQIMFLDSYYDSWNAVEILGINCTQEFASLSECTTQNRNYVQSYHKKIASAMTDLTKLPNVSAFGIACVAHFFTNGKWDNTDYSVPMNSNNTAEAVITKWLNSKTGETFRFLDTVEWPDNKVCSHQVKKNLLEE